MKELVFNHNKNYDILDIQENEETFFYPSGLATKINQVLNRFYVYESDHSFSNIICFDYGINEEGIFSNSENQIVLEFRVPLCSVRAMKLANELNQIGFTIMGFSTEHQRAFAVMPIPKNK